MMDDNILFSIQSYIDHRDRGPADGSDARTSFRATEVRAHDIMV